MREFYYYYKTKKHNHPRVTICLVVDGQDHSRGVSICSRLDSIDKRKGRSLARGRALKAFYTKQTSLPIDRDEGIAIIDDTPSPVFSYKSEYNDELTPYEKKLASNV